MKPTSIRPLGSDWKNQVKIYRDILNLFQIYLGINCNFIPADNYSNWLTLFFARSPQLPHHFETYFGRIKDISLYNRANFDRVRKTRRSFLGEHRGFCDLIIPVISGGKCDGILTAGPFLRTVPNLESLRDQWRDLTGREPSAEDPDFFAYVRMAMDLTVLAPPALAGCRELLEIMASYMAGEMKAGVEERLEILRKGALSHYLPHISWMDVVLGFDKFYPNLKNFSLLTTQETAVQHWEREEFGITRYPTTVFAISHRSIVSEKLSSVELMVMANRLQWEALRVAREMPETVAGRLEKYGAVFVTSPSPDGSAKQARLEIRDRVETIRRRLEKRTGTPLVAGVGSSSTPGSQLTDSRRQAIQAMNFCGTVGRPLVLYEEYADRMPEKTRSGLTPFLQSLLAAYRKGSREEREIAREEYIRQALSFSKEWIESLRMYLLEAVFLATEELRGHFLTQTELDDLVNSLEKRFENAANPQDLSKAFREALDRVSRVIAEPRDGRREILMERVKEHLHRHFAEPVRRKDLAKRVGLSESVFLKSFRRATGQGFSQYLQGIRMEEAKRLLETKTLKITRVAQECGFNSLSYFVQAFTRYTGSSPMRYRRLKQES